MRWKYYLRGLGCGILAATIILAITFRGQKSSLSDSEIIERAKALGMVMDESQKEHLWDFDSTEDNTGGTDAQQAMAENDPAGDNQTSPEGDPAGQNQTVPEGDPTGQNQTSPEGDPAGQNQTVPEGDPAGQNQTSPEGDPNGQGQTPSVPENDPVVQEYITVEISPGVYPWSLSEILLEKGLITDAAEFRSYMQEQGYDDMIASRTYQVPKGATMEELAALFTANPENTP